MNAPHPFSNIDDFAREIERRLRNDAPVHLTLDDAAYDVGTWRDDEWRTDLAIIGYGLAAGCAAVIVFLLAYRGVL